MTIDHGVYTVKRPTASTLQPTIPTTGLPYVVGTAPIYAASDPAEINMPVVVDNYEEAVKKFGYSDDWENFTLCQFMDCWFKKYNLGRLILCNVYDPATMIKAVSPQTFYVADNKVVLPEEAIRDTGITVKDNSTGTTLTLDTDYFTYLENGCVVVYFMTSVSIASIGYNVADTSSVTTVTVAPAFSKISICYSLLGVAPDILCCPKYSRDIGLASEMAYYAKHISEKLTGMALCDMPTTGITNGGAALTAHESCIEDDSVILGFGNCKYKGKTYDLSTQLACVIATRDALTDTPYDSPSNLALCCDGLVNDDGDTLALTDSESNRLNAVGLVTARNTYGGWRTWGNYTSCKTSDTDVANIYINQNRMVSFVSNMLHMTWWKEIDRPLTAQRIESIMDVVNSWGNGLVSRDVLSGFRVEKLASDNTAEDLRDGRITLRVYLCTPFSLQSLYFNVQCDTSYSENALLSI